MTFLDSVTKNLKLFIPTLVVPEIDCAKPRCDSINCFRVKKPERTSDMTCVVPGKALSRN